MKTKYNTFIFIIFISYGLCTQAVNLESISEKKRNELLISIAKDVIMRYGPDYYRDDPKPIIGRALRTNDFKVTYLSKPEEKFEWGEPAKVFFDNYNGLPASITFGNGIVVDISDVYRSYIEQKYYGNKKKALNIKKLVDKEIVQQIKYVTVKPRKQSVETKYSIDSISLKANSQRQSIDTSKNKIKMKMVYTGYSLSGNDTIKKYKMVKDTMR